jgi:hypothetical protein
MTPRVVLASCERFPTGDPDGDEAALPDLLRARGIEARWQPWGFTAQPDEPVVIRATWDYTFEPERFRSWCATVPRLINPLPAVAAHLDKRYLVRLAAHGVATVPTIVVEPGDDPPVMPGEFVVKPVCGAGARFTARFTPAEVAAAGALVARIHVRGGAAVIQPYQPAVGAEGELALVFLGGRYSHAFRKGPVLEPGSIPDDDVFYVEPEITPADADAPSLSIAVSALGAAADDAGVAVGDLVYARVDLVGAPEGLLVLEIELIEPWLGFAFADDGALDRFADALAAAVH